MGKDRKNLLILIPFALIVWYLLCLPVHLFRQPLSATAVTADGTLLGARISADGQWCFPAADHVPEKFARCIVTYEDKRFWWHLGIDYLSAGRALVQNLTRGEVISGASTLSMQVIRLSRPGAPRTLPEKVYEMMLATRLEMRYTKRKILLLYASNAPFGGNVIGLEAAAWRYFGRSADDLSWGESAMLAVLPNAPGLIHPGRARERLLEKRNALLDKLAEKGIIDPTECLLAKDEPLPDKPLPMPDAAYHLLERCRAESGDGPFTLTLDAALQTRVNAIAKRYFDSYHTNLVDNLGVLVVDVHTGEIRAYYGNTRGCAPRLRGADVDMIPAARSSGSTLKPLLYAAMLDAGELLPTSLVKDTPYNYNNFSPQNFGRSYDGAVPAHEVIERSLNVPSVRMLEQFGAERFLQILQRMGFTTIDKDADHYGLSLILGGAEISLQTLARAYYYLAAELAGDPVFEDFAYRTDVRRDRLPARRIPISRAAAYLTFDALSNANRPEEESSWMDFATGRRIAWKTGTSWGNRDAWSVGVNRDWVVAVWVGNSDGEGRSGVTGVSYASPVMFDVFSALPGSGWFARPTDGMTQIEVCHESGFPASDLCPQRDTIWVPDVEEQPDMCRYHRLVHLDAEGRYQVNSSCCPPEQMHAEVRFVLPPAQEWYYMKKHLDYKPLPPKHPLFDAASSGYNPIDIIYPQPDITLVLTRSLTGRENGAVFRAAHADAGATIYWHIDDEFVGETVGEHELRVDPAPGRHVLTLIDEQGARRVSVFTVK
ncbi:MAG: penicillin-binding protein 1C [Bacteroidales bacterium]|nr:penicillin-binding protein 1C [Bacteroidales bacterium]